MTGTTRQGNAVQATVRRAAAADVQKVATAVGDLLIELGATPPSEALLRRAAGELIGDETAGAVLLAECEGEIVGVLAASWQLAIHAAGRYCLIQDLWVRWDWRSRAIGARLLGELRELAKTRGIERIEVGLPSERFRALAATASFYERNGFVPVGPRMRLAPS